MDDREARVNDLHVGGFRKTTIAKHTDEHGAPVDGESGRAGYLGLSPSAREVLEIDIGEISGVVRDGIEGVSNALIVGARDGVVPMTASLRKALGVEKTTALDQKETPGDIVSLVKRGNRLVLIVTSKGGAPVDDYVAKMADRTPTPR